jgi:hypothetical protein
MANSLLHHRTQTFASAERFAMSVSRKPDTPAALMVRTRKE